MLLVHINIGFWKPMSWIAWRTSVLFGFFIINSGTQTLDIANLLPYSLSQCFHSRILVSLSWSLATLRGGQGLVQSAWPEQGEAECTWCATSTGSQVVLPIAERETLLPNLHAKPVRTAFGIVVVLDLSKLHRCPHIAAIGNIYVYCSKEL